ncbi:hypothetical protein [Streptomyces sp. NPDC057284]|uniref:hypothetical protein n=1 Tax=Streptomyces sp. NPDC057284 TaxID=3346083 RepID=UPI0036395EE0
MESIGKKKPRRSFTPEFKAEIVELCRRGDRSVGQIEAENQSGHNVKRACELLKVSRAAFYAR